MTAASPYAMTLYMTCVIAPTDLGAVHPCRGILPYMSFGACFLERPVVESNCDQIPRSIQDETRSHRGQLHPDNLIHSKRQNANRPSQTGQPSQRQDSCSKQEPPEAGQQRRLIRQM